MKPYKSFNELDKDLKVHELEAEIQQEKLKLHLNILRDELSPKTLFANTIGPLAGVAVLKKMFKRFRRKKKRKKR